MKKTIALILLIVIGIMAVCSIAFIAVGCEQQQPDVEETTTLGTLPPETTTGITEETTTAETTTDTTTVETTTGTETTDTTTYPPATVPPVDTETTTPVVPSDAKKVLQVSDFPNGDHLLRIGENTGVRTPCLGHECPYCAYHSGQTEVYVHVSANGTVSVVE